MAVLAIEIDKVDFDESFWPRFHENREAIEQYADTLSNGQVLPAIIVKKKPNGRYLLIDGYHRLQANKSLGYKKIEADIEEMTDFEARALPVSLNAGHGVFLSNREKKEYILKQIKKGDDLKKWAEMARVPERTIRRWTEELRKKWDEEDRQRIVELRQQGKTQEEIAKEVNVSHPTVSRILNNSFVQNGQMAEMNKNSQGEPSEPEIIEVPTTQKPSLMAQAMEEVKNDPEAIRENERIQLENCILDLGKVLVSLRPLLPKAINDPFDWNEDSINIFGMVIEDFERTEPLLKMFFSTLKGKAVKKVDNTF